VAMLHMLYMLCLAIATASASLLSGHVEHVMVSGLYSQQLFPYSKPSLLSLESSYKNGLSCSRRHNN
jgi:hypothetical protein